MFDAIEPLSHAELEHERVEFLPARTVMTTVPFARGGPGLNGDAGGNGAAGGNGVGGSGVGGDGVGGMGGGNIWT